MTYKLMTANRLGDGEVVYLTAEGRWSERFEEAIARDDTEGQDRLARRGVEGERDLKVVGAYLMTVGRAVDGSWRPLSQREAIRAKGPSSRLDLGKQALTSRQPVSPKGADHVSLR